MILIVKRPVCTGGGWGYLGEEAGDEWEFPAPARYGEGGASAADTIPILPNVNADAGVPRTSRRGASRSVGDLTGRYKPLD